MSRPLKSDWIFSTGKPEISCNRCGWKISANTPANAAEMNSVMIDGTLLAIRMPVTTGTISSHGVIWNVLSRAIEYCSIWSVAVASCESPATVKMTSVISNEGTVVIIIYRICLNRGVSVTDEARIVVSESGDILSPK